MSLHPCKIPGLIFLRRGLAAHLFFLLTFVITGLACASPKPKAGTAPSKSAGLVSFSQIGLPQYAQPEAFREDLVISNEGKPMTMKRFVDHGKIRTEMSNDGQQFVMLETGDSKGTIYMLMPGEKRAMKQSRQGMADVSAKAKVPDQESSEEKDAAPPDLKVEDLGDVTLDGAVVRKLRMPFSKDTDVVGWFDKKTGAPVRMESVADGKPSTIEWRNRSVGPQPEALFDVPKGYEVMDMDEMMSKAKGMGGMGAMGGMGGGIGGMAKGYAGGMATGMASNLGGSLGASLGGALGGPLGSVAGRFIGGKVGGMIGKKVVNAIN